eukprot:403340576
MLLPPINTFLSPANYNNRKTNQLEYRSSNNRYQSQEPFERAKQLGGPPPIETLFRGNYDKSNQYYDKGNNDIVDQYKQSLDLMRNLGQNKYMKYNQNGYQSLLTRNHEQFAQEIPNLYSTMDSLPDNQRVEKIKKLKKKYKKLKKDMITFAKNTPDPSSSSQNNDSMIHKMNMQRSISSLQNENALLKNHMIKQDQNVQQPLVIKSTYANQGSSNLSNYDQPRVFITNNSQYDNNENSFINKSSQWEQHYKDKYKSKTMKHKMQSLKNLVQLKDTQLENRMAYDSVHKLSPLAPFTQPGIHPHGDSLTMSYPYLNSLGSPFSSLAVAQSPYSLHSPINHPHLGPHYNSPYYRQRNPSFDYLQAQNKILLNSFDDFNDDIAEPEKYLTDKVPRQSIKSLFAKSKRY